MAGKIEKLEASEMGQGLFQSKPQRMRAQDISFATIAKSSIPIGVLLGTGDDTLCKVCMHHMCIGGVVSILMPFLHFLGGSP